MAEATPGTLIGGDFRLLRPLGAGGMGVVWVAEQLSTGTARAIKLLRPELVANTTELNRFLNEARISARIPSDHVVQMLGAGHDEALGVPWLAMELLEGVSLGAYLRAHERMHPADACEVLAQMCHGLGAGHARRIVHRDVKPENVFLAVPRREGARFTVKVLDFGIAKLMSPTGQTTTVPLGSPVWMSPEQTESRTSVTPATDVWSLGLLMFRTLTGKHFWLTPQPPGGSITALMREIVLEPIPRASDRGAALGCAEWLPPGFDAWFGQCVCREPAERFADASAAKQAFDALIPGWQAARAAPTAKFAFGEIAHHTVGFALVGGGAQAGTTNPIGPGGLGSATTAPAVELLGTGVPVSFGQTAPAGGPTVRFSATDWASQPPTRSRAPLVLAVLGLGGLFGLGAIALVAWQLHAGNVLGLAGAHDTVSHSVSVPAGSKEPGTYIAAYSYTELSQSAGLTFAEAGDRCHAGDQSGSGSSLCSPAQWRFACRQDPKLQQAEVWVGSLASATEATICGGNGTCDSCRTAPVDSKRADRRAPCCSSAPLIRNKNPARVLAPGETWMLTALHGNRYAAGYAMAFQYFAPSVDWYDLPGISAEAAKTLIRERQAQNKDDWSVEEECLAVEGPANGIALTHHCRRTVRAGKEVSAVMTRLEYQRTNPGGAPNLSLRSVRDTALLFKIQR